MLKTDKNKNEEILKLRVSPHSYFFAFFVLIFAAAFALYLEYDIAASFIIVCSAATALLAYGDRFEFDGFRLRRTGFVPRKWAQANARRSSLKLSDIEQVETHAVRSMRRGGRVIYSYKTRLVGKGVVFSLSAGGRRYREMIHAILPKLPESALDTSSIELRDYLSDPKEAETKAEFSDIPPADVLEDSIRNISLGGFSAEQDDAEAEEKAEKLRRLANELKLAGSPARAAEAFRRALRYRPKDAWLLFEFARCLQSFALTERDSAAARKAAALFRLSERRAGTDTRLLSRIGENYFETGEWRRASIVFERCVGTFRGLRGLAEIALREGRLAHVIHNFSAANEIAETRALKRWSQTEADYFSRLNENEEYMEMELSRLGLYDTFGTVRGSALRLAILGFPVIAGGMIMSDVLIANIGWAVSCLSLIVFVVVSIFRRMMAERIPFELIEED